MNNENQPLMVTIRCITYNHEPYIRECLEGFVMQQTNFRFEAIVHDDASTDGTAAIIAEYAEKYPDIIKPLYETENQYSKGDGSLQRIMNAHMHGKYVAMCEGDDYWTDPLKLQKQVDFLEANEEYSMCFHKVNVITENNIKDNTYDHLIEKDYTGDEVLSQWTVPTCSVLYHRYIINKVPKHKNFAVGDNVLFATCARHGKLYCIAGIMASYRRTLNGATFTFIGESRYKHYIALAESFPEFKNTISTLITGSAVSILKCELKHLRLSNFVRLYKEVGKTIGYYILLKSLILNLFGYVKRILAKRNSHNQ